MANLAGVSRAAVSGVLFGPKSTIRVSPETAERVREAAKELGYRPNARARSFKSGRTGTIGLLHGDGFPRAHASKSRYFAALLDGIIDGAFEHGLTLGICPQLFSRTPEDVMADGRFDGLVWYSTFPSAANAERIRQCSVPIVVVHSQASDFGNRLPTVICDNEGGIRMALEHLAGLGHRLVAFAYDAEYLLSESRLRRDAFLRQAPEFGIEPSLIDVRGNRSGVEEYVASRRPHTAIIAHNEEMAADFLVELQTRGVAVPGEVSVVGFDSTDLCESVRPRLTAVSQPLHELGRRAVNMLVEVIGGRMPEPLERVLPCGFDIRESTAVAQS